MRPVVLFYGGDLDHGATHHVAALAEQGYEVIHCPDTVHLRNQVGQALAAAELSGEPIMAILAAEQSRNQAAAGILAAWPQVGVLAQLDSCDNASLVAALQLGVDTWCPRTCSSSVLLLALHGLKRRLEGTVVRMAVPSDRSGVDSALPTPVTPETSVVPLQKWVLSDQAWLLQTPEGHEIPLTSSERGFMLKLVNGPDMSATHHDLLHQAGPGADCAAARTRLGVLVSRLRRKVAEHGATLPVKSLHSRGYMFSGDIAVR